MFQFLNLKIYHFLHELCFKLKKKVWLHVVTTFFALHIKT